MAATVLTLRVDEELIDRLNKRLEVMREETGEGVRLSLSDAGRLSLLDGLKAWEVHHLKRRR